MEKEKSLNELLKEMGVAETDFYTLDREVLEQLKLSRQQVGYLLPVVKDQHGFIISGRHRKAADQNWPEITLTVKDELDRVLKAIHYNVQRRPSVKETASRLLQVAELLEKRGVPTAEVLPQICKLVPYSERWVRQLLPDKYKHEEMKREPKPWVCDCCEQEQSPEEGKAIIKLCPKCLSEFEVWRHERVAEST
jgi:hypothetical protein